MRHKILGLLLLLIVFVAGFWGVAGAQNFRSGNTTGVSSGESVDSALWISGRTIDIAGNVNGDLFCAGQNVTISGTVQGDVICAAQSIVLSGEIGGSLRGAAQTVTVTGRAGRSVSVLTQTFNQGSKGVIGRDASITANDAVLNGSIGRDAAVGASVVHLNGAIGRNAESATSSLNLGSGANIGGNLHYTSEKDASVASGAVVRGTTTKSLPKQNKNQTGAGMFGSAVTFALYLIAAALIVTLVLILLIPHAIHAIVMQGFRSPGKALLVGLIAAIIVPIVIVIAMLTVVGIPFALLLLLTWLILHAFAGVVAAYYLGRVILRKQRNSVIVMLIGTIVLAILLLIPFVGLIVWILASLLGIGMILLALKRNWPRPHYSLDPQPASARK